MITDRSSGQTEALATARWADWKQLSKLTYRPSWFWIGETFDDVRMPIGHLDDRHICLVAGTRGGKGASVVVNNLALWPGSIVVIDPKGENAVITARRRANGSAYCEGMGQKTFILDPFNVVRHDNDDFSDLKARFNPLDAIDAFGEEAIDEAGRIADAIVVQSGNTQDPFWEESARTLIKGLILHIITEEEFEGRRNLITLRQLLMRGDYQGAAFLAQHSPEKNVNPFLLLWEGMCGNAHHDGVVAGIGEALSEMARTAEKTFTSVIEVARRQTEFIDSPGMRRCLEASDFKLADLKTSAEGVSLYLSLPQRYMNTHFRWLRMMTALIITEMEKTRGQPRSGHRVLMLLDEFAGLKRMEVIENAAAQIAGFGVKLVMILQTLGQLKETYKENWQIFLGNSGLKIFFQVDDEFTRTYLSKQIGETEVVRETLSRGNSHGESTGVGMNYSSLGNQAMALSGLIPNSNEGTNSSFSVNSSEGIHKTSLITPDEIGREFARVDDKKDPRYPGLALVLIPGFDPIRLRRANYFENIYFQGRYDPPHDFSAPVPLDKIAIPPSAVDLIRSITAKLYDEFGILNVAKAELVYEAISETNPKHPILALGEAPFAAALFAQVRTKLGAGMALDAAVDLVTDKVLDYFEHNSVGEFPEDVFRVPYKETPAPPKPVVLPTPVPEADWTTEKAVPWEGSPPPERKQLRPGVWAGLCLAAAVIVGAYALNVTSEPTASTASANIAQAAVNRFDLGGFDWKDLSSAQAKSINSALSPIDSKWSIADDTAIIRFSKLPWYTDVHLLQIRDTSWNQPDLAIYYLWDASGNLFRLDGKSDQIHSFNKKYGIKLDRSNVDDYVKFFTFFVRDDQGRPFYIPEDKNDPQILYYFSNSDRTSILERLTPLKLTSQNADGSYEMNTRVIHQNALFDANLKAEASGMVRMTDDNPILTNLSSSINAPIK